MKSINFAEATHVLGVSQGYQPLAVLRTEEKGVVINNSYWQLTIEEITLLQQGHMIHLGVLGGQPPVLMAISNRPIEPLPYGSYKVPTPDDVKQVLVDAETKPKRIICQVCDGKGQVLMPGDGHKSEGLVPCRFCSGGYIDAAN